MIVIILFSPNAYNSINLLYPVSWSFYIIYINFKSLSSNSICSFKNKWLDLGLPPNFTGPFQLHNFLLLLTCQIHLPMTPSSSAASTRRRSIAINAERLTYNGAGNGVCSAKLIGIRKTIVDSASSEYLPVGKSVKECVRMNLRPLYRLSAGHVNNRCN